MRDHSIFKEPIRIDTEERILKPRPDAWKTEVGSEQVEVLSLVNDPERNYRPGWCTYVYYFPECPELEVMAGGINTKTVMAGALWRQGNLLHFGFDLLPNQMNEAGKSLLLNSIVYISRFTEDRPIAVVDSPFAGRATRHRKVIERAFSRDEFGLRYLKAYVAEETLRDAGTEDLDRLKDYFSRHKEFIHANPQGKLKVDTEALAFGAAPRSEDFFPKTLQALRAGNDAPVARNLLERYAPESAPPPESDYNRWQEWWEENRNYLFFCDGGGYRWYIDPLAKARGVPTHDVQGPARASH
ncbi:MAG TPA: hypothetical protein VMS21_08745 [Methylomirabilota bacterium]|nr:hypothetical protein [Methylomirabilota bacterium]